MSVKKCISYRRKTYMYTVFGVGWGTFFLVNRVEHQKLNQTTPYNLFGVRCNTIFLVNRVEHQKRRHLVEFLHFLFIWNPKGGMGPRGPRGPRWGPETLRALGAPRALEALGPSISYFYTILPPSSPAHETLHQLSNYNFVCVVNFPKTLQELIFYTVLIHVVKSLLLEKNN